MTFSDGPTIERKSIEIPGYISIALDYERLFRSQVIADAADADASVDRLIAWHFCPDRAKHDLLFATVFREGELGISKKLRIVSKVLKASYPDLVKPAAFWIRGLDRLRGLRNKLAHGRMELPKDPPPPDKADGVHIWWPKPTGEMALEFISRATVDEQVQHSKHLIVAGVCLMRIVQDRALGPRNAESERGLLALVAACEKAIRENLPYNGLYATR